jgi:hypothetical protein
LQVQFGVLSDYVAVFEPDGDAIRT